MARKIVNNSDPGTATKHGGDSTDYINQYLTGVDQSGTDPVSINTETNFRDLKFRLRNPANTYSYIYNTQAITADRTITLPVLTGDDTPVFQNHDQAIVNKNIQADSQTNVRGFLTDPVVKRWGSYQINSQGILSDGLLSNTFTHGTATVAPSMDPNYGYYQNYQTAGSTNDKAGIQPTTTLAAETMRRWNANFRVRFYTPSSANQRLMMGFSTDTTIPTSDTILSNTASGVIFGYRSTDANYSVFHNNGGGAMTVVASSVPKDTIVRVIEIWLSENGPRAIVTLDNVDIATITTALPASTDPLAFFWILEQTTATQKDLRLYDIYYEDIKA